MKRLAMILFIVALSLGIAVAQTEAGAKSTTSANSNTSASVGQSGAQAGSNTSASTSQEASASQQPAKNEPKQDAKASASGSAGASASAQAGGNSAMLSSGTVIEAALTKSVSANKNKEGDQVEAKTTQDVKSDGQVVIPRGSKLIGHVTKAQAKTKGEAQSESQLGIVFDRALLKNGKEIPLDATIQAVAAAQSAVSSTLMADEPMVSGAGSTMTGAGASGQGQASGGLLGGATSTGGSTAGASVNTVGNVAGGAVNTAAQTTGAVGGTVTGTNSVAAELTSATTGVVGLQGLQLQSAGSNATQGSIIASSSKNVSLDSGTRMLLRVSGQ